MSIKRVFIANRGEIAVRINRACRELDLEVVQAASAADVDSLAARLADRVVEIGAVYWSGGRRCARPRAIRINPGVPIPIGASQVHNIFDEDVANSPGFDGVGDRFRVGANQHCRSQFALERGGQCSEVAALTFSASH